MKTRIFGYELTVVTSLEVETMTIEIPVEMRIGVGGSSLELSIDVDAVRRQIDDVRERIVPKLRDDDPRAAAIVIRAVD